METFKILVQVIKIFLFNKKDSVIEKKKYT